MRLSSQSGRLWLIQSLSVCLFVSLPRFRFNGLYLCYDDSDFDETSWKCWNLGLIDCISTFHKNWFSDDFIMTQHCKRASSASVELVKRALEVRRHTHRQIKFGGAAVSQTVNLATAILLENMSMLQILCLYGDISFPLKIDCSLFISINPKKYYLDLSTRSISFLILEGLVDKRNGIPEASPGDKSYQVPEYSPSFHKYGSTRPIPKYG